jgi:hypothetical protein
LSAAPIFATLCRAQMARAGRGLVHRGTGSDSPGASPRGPQLEALSRRLNAEVEQLRAENARLSVRAPPCSVQPHEAMQE